MPKKKKKIRNRLPNWFYSKSQQKKERAVTHHPRSNTQYKLNSTDKCSVSNQTNIKEAPNFSFLNRTESTRIASLNSPPNIWNTSPKTTMPSPAWEMEAAASVRSETVSASNETLTLLPLTFRPRQQRRRRLWIGNTSKADLILTITTTTTTITIDQRLERCYCFRLGRGRGFICAFF